MPQVAAATGQIFFHRFYYKVSFKRYDVEIASMGALFLAAKREECSPADNTRDGRTTLRIKDFVNVWHTMRQRRMGKVPKECKPINPWMDTFADMKQRLIASERVMLKKLGFILFVEHPHKFVIMYLQQLDMWDLTQVSWNYCNDSLRTTLCCRYPAETIACGALYLAARSKGMKLPQKHAICEIFETRKADVDDVCLTISALYTRDKAKLISVYEKRKIAPKKKTTPKETAAADKKVEATTEKPKGEKGEAAEGKTKNDTDTSPKSDRSEDRDRRNDSHRDGASRSRSHSRSRSRSRARDRRDRRDYDRSSRDRERDRERDRKNGDRDRDRGDRDRDRDRDRERSDKERGDRREKDRDYERRRDRDSDRDRDRDRERDRDRSDRDRDRDRDRRRR